MRGCARSAAGGAVLVASRGRALCGGPRGGVSVCVVRAGSRVGVAARAGARLRVAPAHPPRSRWRRIATLDVGQVALVDLLGYSGALGPVRAVRRALLRSRLAPSS